MKSEKVLFAEYTRPEISPAEDVHSVFADLIKTAKERIKGRVIVDMSENEVKSGKIFTDQKITHTIIELKLTVKIPIE